MTINKEKIIHQATELDFELPKELECALPTEERGIARDEVKLMISHLDTDRVNHSQFKQLDQFLASGDVLVVNTSGTRKSALMGLRENGEKLMVHLSTQLNEKEWVVEIRSPVGTGSKRFFKMQSGETLRLGSSASLTLLKAYYGKSELSVNHLQLWYARLDLPLDPEDYLEKYGTPIRYNYNKKQYPASYYQTVFANELGSAEMPSAGRAFTPELVTRLVAKGIQILPILLHTGVASLEMNERPYEEFYRVPSVTANALNLARTEGRKIIAVGTTVIRALETVTSSYGMTIAGEGWTNVFITPQTGIHAVNGLITGFHEPKASHLLMLEALAGRKHLALAYQTALDHQYQWHEFGDLHLMV